jgi:hypothetical protein
MASVLVRCFDRAIGPHSIVMPRERRPRRSGLSRFALVAALTGWASICGGSGGHALQYQRVPLDPPSVIISARGPIVRGDYNRLRAFLDTLSQTAPSTDRVMGVALDSPGGNVLEADDITIGIRRTGLTVVVPSGSQCSSACFLIFAAAPRRVVAADALIGVHSASEGGDETANSLALTTAIARKAAEFGVPPAIIGKLVQTPPERTTWLTPADLASMGVTVLDDGPRATYPPPVATAPNPGYLSSQGLNSYSPGQDQTAAGYQQGAADRGAWEAWFGRLNGAYRDGAEYWASQRSTPNPGSCYGPAGQNLGDWTAGCLAAKRILTPSDFRRKAEPEYRAGWNSYSG